jgi:hypothetical protein
LRKIEETEWQQNEEMRSEENADGPKIQSSFFSRKLEVMIFLLRPENREKLGLGHVCSNAAFPIVRMNLQFKSLL